MQLFDLSGRVAAVTGGNGGIGLGMAKAMAEAGAAILVVGRDAAKNDAAVADLSADGGQAQAYACDLADDSAAPAVVAEAERRFGGLDIIVNNAGINIRKPPQDLSLIHI